MKTDYEIHFQQEAKTRVVSFKGFAPVPRIGDEVFLERADNTKPEINGVVRNVMWFDGYVRVLVS